MGPHKSCRAQTRRLSADPRGNPTQFPKITSWRLEFMTTDSGTHTSALAIARMKSHLVWATLKYNKNKKRFRRQENHCRAWNLMVRNTQVILTLQMPVLVEHVLRSTQPRKRQRWYALTTALDIRDKRRASATPGWSWSYSYLRDEKRSDSTSPKDLWQYLWASNCSFLFVSFMFTHPQNP